MFAGRVVPHSHLTNVNGMPWVAGSDAVNQTVWVPVERRMKAGMRDVEYDWYTAVRGPARGHTITKKTARRGGLSIPRIRRKNGVYLLKNHPVDRCGKEEIIHDDDVWSKNLMRLRSTEESSLMRGISHGVINISGFSHFSRHSSALEVSLKCSSGHSRRVRMFSWAEMPT